MTVSAALRVKLTAAQTGANEFGGPSYSPVMEAVLNFANGTGANQIDQLCFDERTVAASSNDDIDLAGVLPSAFGGTITMAELAGIVLINAPRDPGGAANVSRLTLGGGTNPFLGFLGGTTPTLGPIGPGGVFVLACPDASGIGAVVASTGDILRIANGAGGPATYQVAFLPRSA